MCKKGTEKDSKSPLADAEKRAREWEENFRKAERLLEKAQDLLRSRMAYEERRQKGATP